MNINTVSIKVAIDDSDFVGIKVKGNVTEIVFPVGYDIKEEKMIWNNTWNNEKKISELKEDVISLMTVLERTESDYYGKGNLKFAFSSAMYIIENYLKYGLYIERAHEYQKNGSGKVDWKRTINKIEPTFFKQGFFYNDLYTEKKQVKDNVITQIQKYCLSISFKVLRWMYNINENIDIPKPFNEEKMIYELNRELYAVNEDSKKQLLEEMMLFLQGTSGEIENQKEFKIGRNKFDKVWEEILRSQIYGLYDELNCKPLTYYHIESTGKDETNSKLIPDITIKDKNRIVIIDAKYYKENSLPQSADICKQLFYGDFIKNKNKKAIIDNIFILPKRLPDKKIERYGYASAQGIDSKNRIGVYYLDIKSVVKDNKIIKHLLKDIIMI